MDVGNMSKTEHDVSNKGPRDARQAGAEETPPPPEMRNWRARLVTRVIHTWFALSRGMTLGVRAAAFDAEGRVFLVRHSYVPGWHMPGGGVERGETMRVSLERELIEEAGVALTAPPALFGIYWNNRASPRQVTGTF